MLPIIAALLSNALPLIANAALAKGNDFVKEKTGVDLSTATLSQEQLTTLRKYEMEHEEELLRLRLEDNKLDLEMQKLYVADTADARKRETAMAESANASWLQKNTGAILACITIALTFAMFAHFVTMDFDKEHEGRKEIVIYILGVLSTITTQIYAYYFGSSAGSAQKTNVLGDALKREQRQNDEGAVK